MRRTCPTIIKVSLFSLSSFFVCLVIKKYTKGEKSRILLSDHRGVHAVSVVPSFPHVELLGTADFGVIVVLVWIFYGHASAPAASGLHIGAGHHDLRVGIHLDYFCHRPDIELSLEFFFVHDLYLLLTKVTK